MKITIQMVVETDEALPPAPVELLTLQRDTLHLGGSCITPQNFGFWKLVLGSGDIEVT